MESIDFETGIQGIQEVENNTQLSAVTSFENIGHFLTARKYPDGLNLNQKRTLRKAAVNFRINDGHLYYIGKSKNEKRLVILDDEKKRHIFQDCHSHNVTSHFGQKKTLEKIESLFFWRGMVKDVVNWIQLCEFCRGKEDKRQSSNKKPRLITSQRDQCSSLHGNSILEDAEDDLLPQTRQLSSHDFTVQTYDLAHYIEAVGHYEKEILNMSLKAELNIDEVLDHLLTKVIKCISRRKRELKLQVFQHKEVALAKVKQAREKLEAYFDSGSNTRKESVFTKDISHETPQINDESTFRTCYPNSSTDIPRREDFGGVWSTFDVDRAVGEFETVLNSFGNVTSNPPYSLSHILPVPAGLRISASETTEGSLMRGGVRRSKLRLLFRQHIPEPLVGTVDESSCHYFHHFQDEPLPLCYVSRVEPHQLYEFYLSYQEEGSTDWSPWIHPYLASTPLPSFSWDSSSNDWHISLDLREANKRINSVTPLFLSAPQFFPGCQICVEMQKKDLTKYPEEGLALVQPWVQFSSLCQEGTLFVNLSGQLYVDGKLTHSFPSKDSNKITLTLESSPHTESSTQGMRVGFCITYETDNYCVQWNLKGQEGSTYIGVQLNNQGSCANIKS